jgi:acyl carrier protein phosphodiesterase
MKTSILLKFYLSGNSPQYQVGALLEDYMNYTSKELYPDDILDGYEHQCYISSVFNTHPAYIKSEKMLDCTLRKNSGKIIPMFYDHFLRSNWDKFSEVSFDDFYKDLSENFSVYRQYLPYKYNRLFNFIYRQSWYSGLQTIAGTHGIMKQQTKRFSFSANMEHSINSLIEHYSEHRNNFFELLPDLKKASREYLEIQKKEHCELIK